MITEFKPIIERHISFWQKRLGVRERFPVKPWSKSEREALRAFNERAAGSRGLSRDVARHIDDLGEPGSLVVIAGQQAGLFVSPLYTLYKAIAAVHWAGRLAEVFECNVIPAFWIASEDHDFEEVSAVARVNREGETVWWKYGLPGKPGQSVFDIPAVKDELNKYLELLETDAPDTEFKAAALGDWRRIAAESSNLEDFFARGMMELLGEFGLVLVSPRLEPIRKRGAEILRVEIEKAGESTNRLLECAEAMRGRSETPPIHRNPEDVNFFVYREGLRCKVVHQGGDFRILKPGSGETLEILKSDKMLAELKAHPDRFSPNVATRPAIQDSALPVIAMIGGPGEQVYMRMIGEAGLPDLFGTCPHLVLARPRAILIEPRVEKLLEKYEIPLSLLENEDWKGLEDHLERAGEGGPALAALDALRANTRLAFERFEREIGLPGRAPEMKTAIERSAEGVEKTLLKMEGRLRELIRREKTYAGQHLDKIARALRPDNSPQERALGPLSPFLINHGPAFIHWLVKNLDLDSERPQTLMLSELER